MRVLIPILLFSLTAGAASFERGSPALALQLSSAMSARQLDAIAVPDRYEPGRFIAVLAFPDVQLLVISAKPELPAVVLRHIEARQYRDAYLELHRGPAAGRIFMHDMGADGLQEGAPDSDTFYEGEHGRTVFDGDWVRQSLTEAAYWQKQEDADAKYSRALVLLLDGVRRIPIGGR